MQATRLLQQLLQDQLQSYEPAIVNDIKNYAATLNQALSEGYSKGQVAAHVMLEVEETMRDRVKWELIRCSKGCAHCCHVNVEMTEGEAEVVVAHCRQNNIEIDQQALQVQRHLSNAERPLHRYARCVFLGDDNACKIYAARPLNCRKHLSQTDPDLCNCAKHANANVGINVDIKTEILVSAHSSISAREGTMAEMLLNRLQAQ